MTQILLVDDQTLNLVYLKSVVGKLPEAKIQSCHSAIHALELSTKHDWDLVIVDYMMPEMDGLAFIQRYRDLPNGKNTPILMVTSSSDPQVKHRLLDLGVVDFLMKPVDASELIARARNLISLHQISKSLIDHNAELRKGVREMTLELALRERESLLVLAKAAESRDPVTGFHLTRMALFSRLIARNMGFSEDEAENIYLAAPMHDVGKIGIPDNILLKKGKLTPDEWAEMRRHTNYGYAILESCQTPILKLGAIIALNHHEAWSGKGYPNGLSKEQIPIEARIVATADVFDALTSARPYKKAWTLTEALSELDTMAGQQLDPACVQAFMRSLAEVQTIQANYADSYA